MEKTTSENKLKLTFAIFMYKKLVWAQIFASELISLTESESTLISTLTSARYS